MEGRGVGVVGRARLDEGGFPCRDRGAGFIGDAGLTGETGAILDDVGFVGDAGAFEGDAGAFAGAFLGEVNFDGDPVAPDVFLDTISDEGSTLLDARSPLLDGRSRLPFPGGVFSCSTRSSSASSSTLTMALTSFASIALPCVSCWRSCSARNLRSSSS